MSVYLKIKVKAEVAESRAICHEERKRLGFLRYCRAEARKNAMARQAGETFSLVTKPEQVPGFALAERDRAYMSHKRRVVLRQETRAMLLAYGFLRGRSHHSMENSIRTCPKWGLVLSYILRFGANPNVTPRRDERALRQTFSGWLADSGLPDNMMPKLATGTDLTKTD